jgi:hypothetical protein
MAARGWGALVLAMLALASVEACTPTEVVVVTDTDATVGQDFDGVQFQLAQGSRADADPNHLPATWGLTPAGSATEFDITIFLNRTSFGDAESNAFAKRTATHVHFVEGELKVLFIPVLKSCGCVGTNCPNPVPKECSNMVAPALPDFDEHNIPHLPKAP